MKKLTTEEFIQKAKDVHGGRYDYSEVDYITAQIKVCIVCREHGRFYQTPNNHLWGKGCYKCAGKGHDHEYYLGCCREKHGDKYVYNNIYHNKGEIWLDVHCKEHGDFSMRFRNHLRGTGCKHCGIEARASKLRKSREQFIKDAKKVHGDTYNYSEVKYISTITNIKIICKVHGPFLQSPATHLNGSGCQLCKVDKIKKCSMFTEEFYLQKVQNVHGDKYSYEYMEYTGSVNKIKIYCKYHDLVFEQNAHAHSTGRGCPQCARKNMWKLYRTDEESNFYLFDMGGEFVKIGLSIDVEGRRKIIERSSGISVKVIKTIKGPANKLLQFEQGILNKLQYQKHHPEMKFDGSTECYERSEISKILDLMDEFKLFYLYEEEYSDVYQQLP